MGIWTQKVTPASAQTLDVHNTSRRSTVIDYSATEEKSSWPVLSPSRSISLVLCLTLSMTMNIMSVQSVVVALPSIGSDLGISNENLQWLVTSYSLTFGCFLLLAGRISDLYGHKIVYLVGTSWFSIWALGCGFAPSEISLDIMRAFQGMGAAASIPSAMGIIAQSFAPGPSKSTAFATFSGGAALGGSLGNIFGGVLTSYAPPGWRAIFYVSSAMAFLIHAVAWFVVPRDVRAENSKNDDLSVDWIGATLVTVGLVILTYTLASGQGAPHGWATPYNPVLIVFSLALLVAFVFWEHHVDTKTKRTPLMRPKLFTFGGFGLMQVLAFFAWACFSSTQFFATLYYQEYRHLSPIFTSLRFLPMAVTGICLNFIVALVAARCPGQILLCLGAIGTTIAPMLFAIIPDGGASYWHYEFSAQILTVFGADLIFSVGVMYCSKVAGKDEQALAGGLFNTLTQIGTAVGLAVMSIIQTSTTQADAMKMGIDYGPSKVSPHALLTGLRSSFWGCVAFGASAFIIAVFGMRGIGTVGEKPQRAAPPQDMESGLIVDKLPFPAAAKLPC